MEKRGLKRREVNGEMSKSTAGNFEVIELKKRLCFFVGKRHKKMIQQRLGISSHLLNHSLKIDYYAKSRRVIIQFTRNPNSSK